MQSSDGEVVGAGDAEPRQDAKDRGESTASGSLLAAWVIGPYLVIQMLALAYLSTLTAFAPDGSSLGRWMPLLPDSISAFLAEMTQENFKSFQRNMIAACSAGLGGAVFMVREFYLSFSYGREKKGQLRIFLRAREIPRYLLLPVSSCVLGPIGIALLQAGAIVFSGYSENRDIPFFTTIAVCFCLGFCYHDTLGGLQAWSGTLWRVPPE